MNAGRGEATARPDSAASAAGLASYRPYALIAPIMMPFTKYF